MVDNKERAISVFSFLEWTHDGQLDLENEWTKNSLMFIVGYSQETLKAAAEYWDFSEAQLGQISLALTNLFNEINEQEAKNPSTIEILANHHSESLIALFEKILQENGPKLGTLVIKGAIEKALVKTKIKKGKTKHSDKEAKK